MTAICHLRRGDLRFFFRLCPARFRFGCSFLFGSRGIQFADTMPNKAEAQIVVKCLILLRLVGYPSGQRGQTVNLLAYAFSGSNPEPTTIFFHRENAGFSRLRFCAFSGFCAPVHKAFKSHTSHAGMSKAHGQRGRRPPGQRLQGGSTPARLNRL